MNVEELRAALVGALHLNPAPTRLLVEIVQRPNVSMRELARELQWGGSQVHFYIRELEAAQLVHRYLDLDLPGARKQRVYRFHAARDVVLRRIDAHRIHLDAAVRHWLP